MANKNVALRNHNGVEWDTLHPQTNADQVITSTAKGFISDAKLAEFEAKESQANKNVANGYAGLDTTGKIPANLLPALAISDTFVTATQAAMLALTAQVGDVAVRTDLQKSFILKTEPATVLANWQELLAPASAVSSVAGKTGAVVLAAADVGLANVTNESKASMFTSPAFTGTPTAPTPAVGTNTTQIATTAYVKSQGYAPTASPAFTGTPTAPTAAAATNTTQVATTAFVKTAVDTATAGMVSTTVSATAPANAKAGDFWYAEL